MAKDIVPELPTAVSTKLVLALIQAHVQNDDAKFMNIAVEIAKELELNNKEELAQYIYAQFGLVRTFTIND